jgi:hypothetical protein
MYILHTLGIWVHPAHPLCTSLIPHLHSVPWLWLWQGPGAQLYGFCCIIWILCCPGFALAVLVVVLPCLLCGTAAACFYVALDRWGHCCLCLSFWCRMSHVACHGGTMIGKLNSDTAAGNSCCFDQFVQYEATASMHNNMPLYHTHWTW